MSRTQPLPVILSVAGSDSSGGAGIQADLKAVSANGGYGATALTALTAQNTTGVTGVVPVSPEFVAQQMRAVFDDLDVAAVKTGMLGDATLIETVAGELSRWSAGPVVVDPVMVATSGALLLPEEAVACLREVLLPLATVLTPNRHEAEVLTGARIQSEEDAAEAARRLVQLGAGAALVKGGHSDDPSVVVDVLWDGAQLHRWTNPRLNTPHTHGTGCTLSSAIATQLGRGLTLPEAITEARAYLQGAIAQGLAIGAGHGPTDHFWWMDRGRRFSAE